MTLSEAQRKLLSLYLKGERHWMEKRRDKWMVSDSLIRKGLIDMRNCPYRDELWYITLAGRAALEKRDG